MNRQQRRALERKLATSFRAERSGLEHPVPTSFRLEGGPMDGWVVKPTAPALRPDWHTTWPDSVRSRWAAGTYVIADEDRGPGRVRSRRARWQTV